MDTENIIQVGDEIEPGEFFTEETASGTVIQIIHPKVSGCSTRLVVVTPEGLTRIVKEEDYRIA